jgi:hypothetical protein
MNEEYREDQVEVTGPIAAEKSGSNRLKWTAFVLSMVAISGVATAGALGGSGDGSGGVCEIQKTVLSFVGGSAQKVEAATEEEAGKPVPCNRRQELMKAGLENSEPMALAASSEGETKTCDKAKAASSEGETKTCDKAKAASSEGETKTCDKAKAASSEGETKTCDKAKAASSEGEKKEGCCADKAKAASSEGEAKTCDKAKAASSEGEAKTCDKAKAASSEGEAKVCPITGNKTTAAV